MRSVDVLRILKCLKSSFRIPDFSVYCGKGSKVVVWNGVIGGVFDVGDLIGLEGLSGWVELSLREFESLVSSCSSIEVVSDTAEYIELDMEDGLYRVKFRKSGRDIDNDVYREVNMRALSLCDLVVSKKALVCADVFDFCSIGWEDVFEIFGTVNLSSMLDCIYVLRNTDKSISKPSQVVVVTPIALFRAYVDYSGACDFMLSRGIWLFMNRIGSLLSGSDVLGVNNVKFVLSEEVEGVLFDYVRGKAGGVLFVARQLSSLDRDRRMILSEEVMNRYLLQPRSRLGVLSEFGYIRSWFGSGVGDDVSVLLIANSEGFIVGLSCSNLRISVLSFGGGDVVDVDANRYMVSSRYLKWLVEAEEGCVMDGSVVWLSKGYMDLFIPVLRKETNML